MSDVVQVFKYKNIMIDLHQSIAGGA